MPISPAMLPMLMMLPPPRAAIFGASAAVRKYGAWMLAVKSRPKVATSSSGVGPNQETPALLTSTSTVSACLARSSSSAGLLRSAAAKRALPPSAVMASTTAWPRTRSRPCTMTSAPCRASCLATAVPMPEVAPVTSALRPSRSRCSFMSCPFSGCILRVCSGARRRYRNADCTFAGAAGGRLAEGSVFGVLVGWCWRAGAGDQVAELVAAGDAELGIGAVQVRADRVRGQEEPVADLAVGQAVAGQPDDLALLGGEFPQGIGFGGRAGDSD